MGLCDLTFCSTRKSIVADHSISTMTRYHCSRGQNEQNAYRTMDKAVSLGFLLSVIFLCHASTFNLVPSPHSCGKMLEIRTKLMDKFSKFSSIPFSLRRPSTLFPLSIHMKILYTVLPALSTLTCYQRYGWRWGGGGGQSVWLPSWGH